MRTAEKERRKQSRRAEIFELKRCPTGWVTRATGRSRCEAPSKGAEGKAPSTVPAGVIGNSAWECIIATSFQIDLRQPSEFVNDETDKPLGTVSSRLEASASSKTGSGVNGGKKQLTPAAAAASLKS